MNRRVLLVGLVLLVFFVISFLTNILGALNPAIKETFHLEFSSLGFMTLAFFSAYGIMSIPSGMLVEKYREKKIMLVAFGLATLGAFTFALFPVFIVFLFSLFLIGSGMAMLQVAINPLLRQAGGEEHFAFNSVLGQLFFGAAGVAGPYLFSYLVENVGRASNSGVIDLLNMLVPHQMNWVSIYWVFGAIALTMVVIIALLKFPKVELNEDEKTGEWSVYKELFANKTVVLFFIGIFCYVGFEQGVSFWISQFLDTYHGIDPDTKGAATVGNFWGSLTVGCFLGLVLLKFIDSKRVLLVFSTLAFVSLTMALFGPAHIALVAFPAVGFFASVMWSIIFSLALNSLKDHHGSVAGILCTGIVGGAVAPFIVGGLGDVFGLKGGMLFNYFTLAYIFSIAIWANPLIKNKTIGGGKTTSNEEVQQEETIEYETIN
ncbi:sugar MFS transporter [Marinoscillum sp. MHG1-6]|uniref:sugar MFS transporter n=1 Tax=Marinoscillum sp. MHG1-6 TaxID=2959627 RepID=UPI002158077F|nr:sugar MFS transporter [Marinoscillum sp. MHG1-6]